MNNDTCSTATSSISTFGEAIKPGTPVTITIRKTGVALNATVSSAVRKGDIDGSFHLEGMSYPNAFYARDIEVAVVEPPIEPGFYINKLGVIFYITGRKFDHPLLVNLASISRGTGAGDRASGFEESYYKEIREGKTVRIADANGIPVSA
ncbi:hypothetical protein SEA_FORK_108 [Microbacterium phage Fork]|nr:hypothetical protein SEA_FORK_108 [Microbacterium phage Fork]